MQSLSNRKRERRDEKQKTRLGGASAEHVQEQDDLFYATKRARGNIGPSGADGVENLNE